MRYDCEMQTSCNCPSQYYISELILSFTSSKLRIFQPHHLLVLWSRLRSAHALLFAFSISSVLD